MIERIGKCLLTLVVIPFILCCLCFVILVVLLLPIIVLIRPDIVKINWRMNK